MLGKNPTSSNQEELYEISCKIFLRCLCLAAARISLSLKNPPLLMKAVVGTLVKLLNVSEEIVARIVAAILTVLIGAINRYLPNPVLI